MIKLEALSGRIIKLVAPEKLTALDFDTIEPQADALIRDFGSLRLLIDATQLTGWENLTAFERHMGFVKLHHHKVDRIAVLIGHDWQKWIASMAGFFLHPEIRAFEPDKESDALTWLGNAAP